MAVGRRSRSRGVRALAAGDSIGRSPWVAPVVAAAVAAVLVAIPLSVGASGNATRIPPFVGGSIVISHSKGGTGCWNATFPSWPHANLTTGRLTLAVRPSIQRCAQDTHTSYSQAGASVGIRLPGFSANASGTRNISYRWQIQASIRAGGHASYGQIRIDGNLYDQTTGTWAFRNNVSTLVCYTATVPVCNGKSYLLLPVNVTGWVNFTANVSSGHHYRFFAEVSAYADERYCFVFFGRYYCNPGIAFIDLGPPTGGATLLSIRVS